jgi:hypothetical protein
LTNMKTPVIMKSLKNHKIMKDFSKRWTIANMTLRTFLR